MKTEKEIRDKMAELEAEYRDSLSAQDMARLSSSISLLKWILNEPYHAP